MDRDFQDYIDIIVDSIGVNGKKRKQIRDDLYASLMEKQDATGENDPYVLLGDPEEIAEEFRENLEINNAPRGTCNHRCGYGYGYEYEYISKRKLLGIPLVHVNTKPFGIAKGIFSFGSISIGVFSFGALSLALLIAFGGAALSGMLSFGGLAISYMASLGGAAIAKYIAFGGYASGDIAIGGITKGIVAVFNQHGTGQYMFKNPVNPDEVITAIKQVYPNIEGFLLDLIRNFI